jgi:hypothetical protein
MSAHVAFLGEVFSVRLPKLQKLKPKVELGAFVRWCPGRHHAWFESNVGLIRKPCCWVEDVDVEWQLTQKK